MFPWRSAWSTSGKPGLPERRLELLGAHRLGSGSEVAQLLPQVEALAHLGEVRGRVGRDEQARRDAVFLEVADERRAAGRPRVALAMAPDLVGLARQAGRNLLQVVADVAVVGGAEQQLPAGHHGPAPEVGAGQPGERTLLAVGDAGERGAERVLVLHR